MCSVIVLCYSSLSPLWLSYHLVEEERLGYFAFMWVSLFVRVLMLVLRGAMGLHVSCDCGASLTKLRLLFVCSVVCFYFVLFCFGLVAWFVSASQ